MQWDTDCSGEHFCQKLDFFIPFLEDCFLIFSILISGYRKYPHFGLQSIDHKIIWRKSKIIRFSGFKPKSNDIILGYIYSYRIASIGLSAEAFLAG